MFKVSISSLEECFEFAKDLAECFPKGLKLYLDGDLGAGKTTFSNFFLEALGIKQLHGSPTYTLVNEYFLEKDKVLRHFDLYRLSEEEFLEQGFLELLEEADYALVEWASLFKQSLPREALHMYIEKPSESTEILELEDVLSVNPKRNFLLEVDEKLLQNASLLNEKLWKTLLERWSSQ